MYMHVYIYTYMYVYVYTYTYAEIKTNLIGASPASNTCYGVALVSRIDKIIRLFCKRALSKRRCSAKETDHSIDPTDRSHPIYTCIHIHSDVCIHISIYIYAESKNKLLGASPAPDTCIYTWIHIHIHVHVYVYTYTYAEIKTNLIGDSPAWDACYGVALVSRIDKIIRLFCKRALSKRSCSAKETDHSIDPTDRSHPIYTCIHIHSDVCMHISIYIYAESKNKLLGTSPTPHTCIYTWIHIHIHVYVHVHIYMYMYTYMYTYAEIKTELLGASPAPDTCIYMYIYV